MNKPRANFIPVIGGLLCAGGLAVLLSASAAAADSAPAPELVWPDPPDAPRIRFVQAFSQPAALGVKRSGPKRFFAWLTGSEKGNETLQKPFGLALDEDDNLCLTDTSDNSVSFLDRTQKKWSHWDRIGTNTFLTPVAVAKRGGVFYVADSGRGCVFAFQDGKKIKFSLTNQLQQPCALAVTGDRLFVVDARRHCVVTFDLAGSYLGEFGSRGTAPGQFNFPTHITADPAGNLLVTDSLNCRVQIFDATGNFKTAFGRVGDAPGNFSRPKGVAVDAHGHIYVVDGMFDHVQIFDPQGRVLLHFGEGGTDPGQFWLPNGIAITRQNEIFVADSYNHRVQIFQYVGQQ